MKNKLIISYFFLCLLNIYAVVTNWQSGIYFSKPLLMTVLALWFYINTKDKFSIFVKIILIAIIFSIGGDTFLMFVDLNPNYFLAGLGCFLITQILYIAGFSVFKKFKNGLIVKRKWIILPVVIYLLLISKYLYPDIPNAFLIPVIIYSIVISTMLASAINMKGRVGEQTSNGLLLGALLFVVSDSFIAINKFKDIGVSTEIMGLIIMTTYLTGQYFIVSNSVEANEKNYRT